MTVDIRLRFNKDSVEENVRAIYKFLNSYSSQSRRHIAVEMMIKGIYYTKREKALLGTPNAEALIFGSADLNHGSTLTSSQQISESVAKIETEDLQFDVAEQHQSAEGISEASTSATAATASDQPISEHDSSEAVDSKDSYVEPNFDDIPQV
jgi:hypothetical protein